MSSRSTVRTLLAQNVAAADTTLIDLDGIAALLGVAPNSARVYHTRATGNRRAGTPKPGDLPVPDVVLGGRPGWRRDTIDAWIAQRPGKGRVDPAARRAWLQRHRDDLAARYIELGAALMVVDRELSGLDE